MTTPHFVVEHRLVFAPATGGVLSTILSTLEKLVAQNDTILAVLDAAKQEIIESKERAVNAEQKLDAVLQSNAAIRGDIDNLNTTISALKDLLASAGDSVPQPVADKIAEFADLVAGLSAKVATVETKAAAAATDAAAIDELTPPPAA